MRLWGNRVQVNWTIEFEKWLDNLPDGIAAACIVARIARLREGLFGDVRPLGGGLAEMKVDHGPGYRLYFVRRGQELVLILWGGDKSTQSRDIARARTMLEEMRN